MTTQGFKITKSTTVLYEKRDGIARVTLNRPEVLNAQNAELGLALGRAMTEASNDDEVRVVILTGAGGKAFSAGADLKERSQQEAGGELYFYPGMREGRQVLAECPKPVIAAIDGYALAGGMQLAARCDIRIATEKSRFGMPEPRRGMPVINSVDTMEMGYMPRGEAMWIILTGSHMTAQRAYDIGYIQALVPDREALFAEAERVANEIKKCAPLATRAQKTGARLWYDLPAPPQGMRPTEHVRELNKPNRERAEKSEDRLEGPRAFAEKRDPKWKGR